MMPRNSRAGAQVLDAFIDAGSSETALDRIITWATNRESRYVCICSAHSIVTATHDRGHRETLNRADMATPDGAPVAWMLRQLGYPNQERVTGSELTVQLFAESERRGVPLYFYGSGEDVIRRLENRIVGDFPNVKLAGLESPPFRELTPAEDAAAVARINASNAGIVFVGLGCPKQEQWMCEHRGHVQAVMIGVGAAFEFYAGTLERVPLWMQRSGLEWLHRLLSEPRRLWKRYLVTNTLFVFHAARQLMFGHAPGR